MTAAAAGTIGVLALQGDFAAHEDVLSAAGIATRRVRTPRDLQGLRGIVLPGGESTTISKGLERCQILSGVNSPGCSRPAAAVKSASECMVLRWKW